MDLKAVKILIKPKTCALGYEMRLWLSLVKQCHSE